MGEGRSGYDEECDKWSDRKIDTNTQKGIIKIYACIMRYNIKQKNDGINRI